MHKDPIMVNGVKKKYQEVVLGIDFIFLICFLLWLI